jgi:hypothetical protein
MRSLFLEGMLQVSAACSPVDLGAVTVGAVTVSLPMSFVVKARGRSDVRPVTPDL